MNFQYIMVGLIIAGALIYAASTILRKRRAFSTKSGCEADCGCSGGSKKLPS